MKEKNSSSQSVSKKEFLQESKCVRSEIKQLDDKVNKLDGKVNKLDDKVNKVALKIIHIEEDLNQVKETMLTKLDGQKIIDHIDAFAHRIETYDRKAIVHAR